MSFLSRLATFCALATLLPASGAAQVADGERVFRQRCVSCHSIDPGENRVGPSLSNVVGREAGRVEGARYSKALLGANLVWDAQTLDAFLADPNALVPGTSMRIRIANPTQRVAVIRYLGATD
ncbi:c-type cytochrome (plasmid) [Roseibium aggregatum]|uniref:c-type cytochrome n=1 Tax=Roseibium aggregatum TaxID=187304 RepID=UPI001E3AE9A1|nr:c-type cytochrome [Roseibium aggregatum]UES60017.1 c-type cytochrome [Roseibium aggregatum]UES60141.1 c-type cytochrome [Roseibium aggregatum]